MKDLNTKTKKIRINQEFPKEVLADPRITKEIGILKCIQCGRCSASCPSAAIYDDFSPRDMMRSLNLGNLDDLLKSESIWRCAQCYTCHSRCPRNNSPATIILILRELAIKKGYANEKIKSIVGNIGNNIWEKGVSLSPDIITNDFLKEFNTEVREKWDKMKDIRKNLGYYDKSGRTEPIPENAINEIRTIIGLTDTNNIIIKKRGGKK